MSDTIVDENPESTSEEEEVMAMPAKSQKYEMMVIISSELSDEQIKKSVKAVKALLGGDVFYEEIWGMRPFAYPIKGQDKGYYVVWNFSHDPQEVKEMEAVFKLMPEVVRYLVMKIPENYKPVTMKEMDAGMDELRKEKEEKRGQTKTAAQRRVEKKDEPEKDDKAPEKTEEKKEAPAAEKKSLDEKLDDILSDADLGL